MADQVTGERETVNRLVSLWLQGLLSPSDDRQFAHLVDLRVRAILHQVRVPPSARVDHEDLVSIGICAALECAPRWEEDKGDFWTFSYARIRGAVHDYLRKVDPVSRPTRSILGKVNRARRILVQKRGRAVDAIDIANHVDMDLDKVRDAIEAGAGRERISLDESLDEDAEETLLSVLSGFGDVFDEDMILAEFRRAIASLPDRSAQVLVDVYVRDIPQRDVALRHGVTEARISQIRQAAIAQVRRVLVGVD